MERRLILRKLEVLIQRAMEKNNHTKLQMFLFLPLFCLARIYLSFGRWREIAYQHGLRPVDKLPCRVICVGNLTLGGTGKTPIVELIGQTLLRRGERVGIISRGYGGMASTWPQVVSADSDPHLVGDEPVLIARRTGCPMVVAPDRVAAARALLAQS
ncbi:MAG: tetraacyldisaccharide 4'-kinase, partial [bacterium]